jgi:hypothetical protein
MSKARKWLALPLATLLLVALLAVACTPDSLTPAERAARARVEDRQSLEVIRVHLDPYKGRTPKRALTPAEIDPYKYGTVDFSGSPPNKIYCIYVGGTWIKGYPDPANMPGAHGHCFDWKVTL